MGHPFVLLVDDAERGRRCAAELNSRSSAKTLASSESYVAKSPAVYQQVKAGAWRRVRFAKSKVAP